MFTTSMSLNYAQSVKEEHLRRAQNRPCFAQIQARNPLQSTYVDKLADLLITSGRSLKQRYQAV